MSDEYFIGGSWNQGNAPATSVIKVNKEIND